MDFTPMTAEQYRSLDIEALDARRTEVEEAINGDVDLEAVRSEVSLLEAEYERRNAAAHVRSMHVHAIKSGAAPVVESSKPEEREADMFDTAEYRKAFMGFIQHGTPVPEQYRDSDAITIAGGSPSGDTGAVIPTTLVREIQRKMEVYGEIWPRVRKMNLKGAVEYPVLDLKPTATWITANTGTSESYDQKIQANSKISFSYYGLECKVAQTLLASVVTIEEFQRLFVELVSEAMVKALEQAIFNGSGSGEPTGITVDSKVPAANKIDMTATNIDNWHDWQQMVKAKMKKAYRNGVFVMAQGTWDGHVAALVDDNGQPIARVTDGINGEEVYRFMGKEVITVEDDLVADFDSASDGDVFAIFVDFSNYVVNTNMQMQTARWIDYDKNVIKNKAIMICDGKLLDANGVLLISKDA